MKKLGVIIFFSVLSTFLGQNLPKGNLEGIILESGTKQPLIGVNIYVLDNQMGTSTNSKGNYTIKDLPVGTYTLQFSYVGFEKVTKTDIIIRSKRTTYLNVDLNPSTLELENVVVESGYFHEL